MFVLTRIQLFLLISCKLMLCWHPALGDFTHETCLELNTNPNISCTKGNYSTIFAIGFKYRFQITVSPNYKSLIMRCSSTAGSEFGISTKLPKLQLGQLNHIIIDGCLPFDDIFQQLGISTGRGIKLYGGAAQLKRDHLAPLTGVTEFELSGFDQLDADVFADMVGIENLHLSFLDPLTEGLLATISEHLLKLQIVDCGMKTIPAGLFAPRNRLEHLDLSSNKLNTIASGTFDSLYNLTELDLSYNLLSHLPADLFHSLGKLILLSLSNNRLKELERGTFAKLSNLRYLKLGNNELELASTEACYLFVGLYKLKYLDISDKVHCLY